MSEYEDDTLLTKGDGGHIYKRSFSERRLALQRQVTDLYHGAGTLTFDTGMNVIMLTLQALVMARTQREGTIFIPKEVYGNTKSKVAKCLQNIFPGVIISFYDPRDPLDDLRYTFLDANTICVFAESATNPTGYHIDFEKLDLPAETPLVVDNTWLSPALYNPLKQGPYDRGADIVVESTTKYLSAGTTFGGIACFADTTKAFYRQARELISIYGIHITEQQCETISNNLQTLDRRMRDTSQKAKEIVETLCNSLCVDQIYHCAVEGRSYRDGLVPGVIYFHILTKSNIKKKSEARSLIKGACKETNIKYGTSYGKAVGILDYWTGPGHSNKPHYKKVEGPQYPGHWMRYAVGYSADRQAEELLYIVQTLHAKWN
jgi:cystathionine beta-lyase/cystathionine gamma-synthase